MSGISPLAAWANAQRQATQGGQLLPGPGYRLKQLPNGTAIEILPHGGAGSGSPLNWYQFITMNDDDMDCYLWNDASHTAGTTIIKITKPPLLRGSLANRQAGGVAIQYTNWNKLSQSRVATNGTGSITQFITPIYAVGDLLIAAAMGSNSIVDLNIDGRVFAGPSQ